MYLTARLTTLIVETCIKEKMAAPKRDRGDRATQQQRKLFIGGLHYQTTEETLESFYAQWGDIVDSVVMRDPASGRSRGFGFIMYKEMDSLDISLNNRPHVIDGKQVDPKRAVPLEDSVNLSGRSGSVKKIFVGGIGTDTQEAHLQEYFSRYGNVESVAIVTEKETGKSRGFGFVTFDDYDPVDKIVLMKHHEVNGHQCEVKKAQPRQDEMGGGRGGRSMSRGGGGGGGGKYGAPGRGGSAYGGGMGGYGGGYGGAVRAYGGGGGGYDGYGAEGYPAAYGAAYGMDAGYPSGYGSGFGTGYGGGYGGGAVKSAGYASKAAGPYGGGYGSGTGYSSGSTGYPAGAAYGTGASSYGGASAYSSSAYGASSAYGSSAYSGY